jgi:hypothetical protein
MFTRRYWLPTPASAPPGGGPPVVESVGTFAFVDGTLPLTLAKPSGLAVGDLMVMFGMSRAANATSVMSASGWTGPTVDTSTNCGTRITPLWKVADSADVAASTFDFSASGLGDHHAGVILRISGAHATSPFAAAVANVQTDTATTTNPLASGTVASGDYLALTATSRNDNTAFTEPSTYTLRLDDGFDLARDGELGVASKELTGITSEDPGNWTHASDANQRHVWTILIAAA